jgi:hypothetical protein
MKININNKGYKFPSNLSMGQWSYLVENFEFGNPLDHAPIIHYLTGAPLEYLQEAESETLVLAIAFVVQMLNKRTPIKGKSFEDITFGEFIDLDIYLNMGVHRYWKEVLQILDVEDKGSEYSLFAIEQYNQYRTHIYRSYKKLFEIEDHQFDEEAEKSFDPQQVARNWYKIIVGLANDDLLRIDEVTDQPLKKALNFMAYQKEKQIEENLKQLQRKREYDLQRNRRSH